MELRGAWREGDEATNRILGTLSNKRSPRLTRPPRRQGAEGRGGAGYDQTLDSGGRRGARATKEGATLADGLPRELARVTHPLSTVPPCTPSRPHPFDLKPAPREDACAGHHTTAQSNTSIFYFLATHRIGRGRAWGARGHRRGLTECPRAVHEGKLFRLGVGVVVRDAAVLAVRVPGATTPREVTCRGGTGPRNQQPPRYTTEGGSRALPALGSGQPASQPTLVWFAQ